MIGSVPVLADTKQEKIYPLKDRMCMKKFTYL